MGASVGASVGTEQWIPAARKSPECTAVHCSLFTVQALLPEHAARTQRSHGFTVQSIFSISRIRRRTGEAPED